MSDEIGTLPNVVKIDPYQDWQADEGIRVVEGMYCPT